LAIAAANLLALGTSYAINLSAPAVLQELTHLDVTRIGLIVAAASMLGAIAMLVNGWRSDRRGA